LLSEAKSHEQQGWNMVKNGLTDCCRFKFDHQRKVIDYEEKRQEGTIPFVHIEETNIKSMNLAIKLGFRKDRRVHWFEIQWS
jgi:hypothetical protein